MCRAVDFRLDPTIEDGGEAGVDRGKGPRGGKIRDPNRPRRAAVRDVSRLVAEYAMLEAMRRIMFANDLRRPVAEEDDKVLVKVG